MLGVDFYVNKCNFILLFLMILKFFVDGSIKNLFNWYFMIGLLSFKNYILI